MNASYITPVIYGKFILNKGQVVSSTSIGVLYLKNYIVLNGFSEF